MVYIKETRQISNFQSVELTRPGLTCAYASFIESFRCLVDNRFRAGQYIKRALCGSVPAQMVTVWAMFWLCLYIHVAKINGIGDNQKTRK